MQSDHAMSSREEEVEKEDEKENCQLLMNIHNGCVVSSDKYRTQFHENVLVRTVLNAGNMDGQKGHNYATSVSTTLWTSRWSKGDFEYGIFH